MKQPFKPSLRSLLTLQAGAIIFLAAIICAVSLLFLSLEESREEMDNSLLRESKAIQHILTSIPTQKETVLLLKTLLAAEPDRRMAEIRQPNGKTLLISTHANIPILLDDSIVSPKQPFYVSKNLQGRARRILYFPANDVLIAVAAQPESIRETLQNVLILYIALTIVLLFIILWGGKWLASRALAPIVEMADATERIQTLDTNQRLPIGQSDEEIHRLSAVLNAMLDRLQTNFTLVRRFTADAAHEIKTPLAIIQGHLEAALHDETPTSANQENTLLLTLREVARLNHLVEGLLLLSRSDAGHLELILEPLDWSALAHEFLHDADILCAPLHLKITTDIAPDVLISADRHHLRQVMLNLLDNACKYNRPHGSIHIALRIDDTSAHLEIGNTGPAIPAGAIPLLFERFQRGDTSRTRGQQDGLGLGLSISREILRAHGAQIAFVQSGNDWTLFSVTFSLAEKNDKTVIR